MIEPTQQNLDAALIVLDMYDRDYREAVRIHQEDFPPYVPNDRIERIAYDQRKQDIKSLKKRLEAMQADYLALSLAAFRLRK